MNFITLLIIIFTGVNVCKSFIYLQNKINKTNKILEHSYKKMKTCFEDDDDDNYKKTVTMSNFINNYLMDNLIKENKNASQKNKPLYTLFWYYCVNCK